MNSRLASSRWEEWEPHNGVRLVASSQSPTSALSGTNVFRFLAAADAFDAILYRVDKPRRSSLSANTNDMRRQAVFLGMFCTQYHGNDC